IFHGEPTIGGRYSVLSQFGMVPAAAIGIDVRRFLERAGEMVRSCAASAPPVENPGVLLGAILGVAAQKGRDKVTVIASPGVAALESAGQRVVRITVSEPMQLGQEFFRWEMATAVAGSILGINPFDQPDVEAQKVKTRELTSAYEKSGTLPPETPFFTADGIELFADPENAVALKPHATSLAAILKAHLARVHAGDYVALLAYIERNAAHTEALQRLRRMIRDRTRAATCLGFGPRFLHSTGQNRGRSRRG